MECFTTKSCGLGKISKMKICFFKSVQHAARMQDLSLEVMLSPPK